jgi:hypothetical protein
VEVGYRHEKGRITCANLFLPIQRAPRLDLSSPHAYLQQLTRPSNRSIMALLSHNERAQFDSFLSTFGGSSTTGLPPTLSPPSLGRRSATSTGTDTEGGSAMDHDGFRGTSGDGERGGKDDDEVSCERLSRRKLLVLASGNDPHYSCCVM